MKASLLTRAAMAAILTLGATACDDMNDAAKAPHANLTFVGDSIIDCWSVDSYFSSWTVTNEGISGSHIDYLQERAGRYTGKEIVVMIGTNDYYRMAADSREEYVDEYIAALDALDADFIYLYSVLPRSRESLYDPSVDANADIRAFNAEVKTRLDGRPDICYLDVHAAFTRPGAGIISGYFSDGLHPNASGYQVLALALCGAVYNHESGKIPQR